MENGECGPFFLHSSFSILSFPLAAFDLAQPTVPVIRHLPL